MTTVKMPRESSCPGAKELGHRVALVPVATGAVIEKGSWRCNTTSQPRLPNKDDNSTDLPQWDLSRLFPGLHSPEFEGGVRVADQDDDLDLECEFERLGVGWGPPEAS